MVKKITITHTGEDYIKVEVVEDGVSIEYEIEYPAADIIKTLLDQLNNKQQ